jgi:hypothetical protein
MNTRESIACALRAVASLFLSGFILWFAYGSWVRAYDGYCIEKYWHSPASPYVARVVGFPIWGNNGREKIPTVRVTYANGKTAEFNSSRKGTYSAGDVVRVLKSSNEVRLVIEGTLLEKQVSDLYEIDSPYLLWIKDAWSGVLLLIVAVASPIVGFAPIVAFSRSRRAGEAGGQPGERAPAAGAAAGETPPAAPAGTRYEARFIPTGDDAVTAYRMDKGQDDDAWKLFLFGAVLLALVFAVAAYVLKFPALAVFGLAIGSATFGVIKLRERQVRSGAPISEAAEVHCYFSDEGLDVARCGSRSRYPWDKITRASLDGRGILVYTVSGGYSFIPARAFPGGYFPRDELKSFLSSKLKHA